MIIVQRGLTKEFICRPYFADILGIISVQKGMPLAPA